jgi:hypothetical protein
MKFFQGIGRLRLLGAVDTLNDLSDRSRRFARAIAGPIEQLRLAAFAAANRFWRQASLDAPIDTINSSVPSIVFVV